MYLIAIICPPIAVLLCGKPIQAVLNILLSLLFYIPGLIHAILVVNEYKADKRAGMRMPDKSSMGGKKTDISRSSNGSLADVLGAAAQADPLDEIEKLGHLKERGLITEEEFRAKKKQILGI